MSRTKPPKSPIKTDPWSPRGLRECLGFDIRQWARLLNVSVRTVERWENEGVDPAGLPTEVLRGIGGALDAGVPSTEIRGRIEFGIAAFIQLGLTNGRGK